MDAKHFSEQFAEYSREVEFELGLNRQALWDQVTRDLESLERLIGDGCDVTDCLQSLYLSLTGLLVTRVGFQYRGMVCPEVHDLLHRWSTQRPSSDELLLRLQQLHGHAIDRDTDGTPFVYQLLKMAGLVCAWMTHLAQQQEEA